MEGKQLSTSIDSLGFHAALILSVTALAYVVFNFIKANNVVYLKSIAVWTYAIFLMFGVWGIMCKLKLQHLVDSKVKSKLSGMLTEYAIIAAIASMPVKNHSSIYCTDNFPCYSWVYIYFYLYFLFSKWYIKEDWF